MQKVREMRWGKWMNNPEYAGYEARVKFFSYLFKAKSSKYVGVLNGVTLDAEGFLSIKYQADKGDAVVNEYITTSRLKKFLKNTLGVNKLIVDVTSSVNGKGVYYDILISSAPRPLTVTEINELKNRMDNPVLVESVGDYDLTGITCDEFSYR